MKSIRKWSPGRLSACWGASLAAFVLVVVVLIFVFGNAILDGYGKRKAERAFAETHPGSVLRIGGLDYSTGANRLVAHFVTLSTSKTTLKAEQVSLTGVRWARLLLGTAPLADVLAQAGLEATNLEVEFPRAYYQVRCSRFQASVPDSALIAEGTELRPLVGDETFFAKHEFRTTRFHVILPECRVSGLEYGELFEGKSYRARSVDFSHPSFDALVDRGKPPKPFVTSPPMVQGALASIRPPLQVGSLNITNGTIRYCERLAVRAVPAVLTFGEVTLAIDGIANRGDATAVIQLRAQGDLMDAGTLKVLMSIPVSSTNLSLHYSGSLSAMDLTRLDAFLDIAEHIRIKSGNAQEATFEIDVTDGQARGWVRAIYRDLEIAVLDKQTGDEKGLANRVASLVANVFKVRAANLPDGGSLRKEGKVGYTRKPEDSFLQFVWFALRTGVLDSISH